MFHANVPGDPSFYKQHDDVKILAEQIMLYMIEDLDIQSGLIYDDENDLIAGVTYNGFNEGDSPNEYKFILTIIPVRKFLYYTLYRDINGWVMECIDA